jgi:hypothetical protein
MKGLRLLRIFFIDRYITKPHCKELNKTNEQMSKFIPCLLGEPDHQHAPSHPENESETDEENKEDTEEEEGVESEKEHTEEEGESSEDEDEPPHVLGRKLGRCEARLEDVFVLHKLEVRDLKDRYARLSRYAAFLEHQLGRARINTGDRTFRKYAET